MICYIKFKFCGLSTSFVTHHWDDYTMSGKYRNGDMAFIGVFSFKYVTKLRKRKKKFFLNYG